MKRVAANKVLIDSTTIENNLMIERDDNGRVRRMVCITDCQVEPSSTLFYNGLITTDVDLSKREVGISVIDMVQDALAIGYSGRLLLWQNLSLSEFRIKEETKVIVI
ncbi:MAG: hypothetical protein J6R43_02500 [Paludibacteraceae bacterium]|nr:hypothetical protein [Paludibacteraceae bacterium]